ncbi:S8 family serine peptidase [Methyloceanibacter sp.]|uniref:S8 family serine peptidase n=1 Tax=Methyloceanibacter sp. TaxID=1965321 RepID=UPI003D6D8CEB
MAQELVVRLVPKTRSAAPRLDFALESVRAKPQEFAPDPRRARSALSFFAEHPNVEVVPTEKDRLEVTVGRKDFTQLFGASLRQGEYSNRDKFRLTASEKFLVPEQPLQVPDALKETIEFAYLPRPIEFYGPSARPPSECVAHLRLEDVCAILNAPRAHRQKWTGAGIKVAMVDSGFYAHPFFAANGYKLIPSASPGAGKPDQDDSGHGTGECANIFTIAPDCTVYGVKSGPSAATSLEAAIALEPDVMSNSWGFDVDTVSRDQLKSQDPNFFSELVDIETILSNAIQAGIIVVFSAGNGHHAFPGSMPQVIAAGGVTVREDGSLEASGYASSFQSKIYPGRKVPDLCGIVGAASAKPMPHHIMLPVPPESELDGENFTSKQKKTGWGIFSGTSAACPQLAGAIALLKSIRKSVTADQARVALTKTSTDISTGKTAMGDKAAVGPDLATGAGLASVRTACEFIAAIA